MFGRECGTVENGACADLRRLHARRIHGNVFPETNGRITRSRMNMSERRDPVARISSTGFHLHEYTYKSSSISEMTSLLWPSSVFTFVGGTSVVSFSVSPNWLDSSLKRLDDSYGFPFSSSSICAGRSTRRGQHNRLLFRPTSQFKQSNRRHECASPARCIAAPSGDTLPATLEANTHHTLWYPQSCFRMRRRMLCAENLRG